MGLYVLRLSEPLKAPRSVAPPGLPGIRSMSIWFQASSDEEATWHIRKQSFARLLAANPSAVLFDQEGRVVCGA
jgi:hypothetical protein